MNRLPTGGLIDRTQPLSFSFDGRRYRGLHGDTLASALIANGVRLVGRSFKYHRPRGIMTAGGEEPNALVTLGTGAHAEPNTRATTTPLFEGLEAVSQNRWPNLSFDLMAINQLAAPFFVAGFYYKTFMWPARLWERLYEPLIRRAAGLGSLSTLPDPDSYDRSHAFCDLLVIGGGPAGLAAATVAGRAGMRVILIDEDVEPGGRLLAERHEVDGLPGVLWTRKVAAELASLTNVTLLPRSSVFGVFDGREYCVVERLAEQLAAPLLGQPRQRLWKIIAKRALLATGAIERPLVFGGNDRPGVMTASAVSTYINRYAVAPGKRAVVFTTSDSGWATAWDLYDAGIEIAAVVDSRSARPAAADQLRRAGVEIFNAATVTDVHGRQVRSIDICQADGRKRRVSADLLAVAGGWNPTIGLASNLGNRPIWSDLIGSFVIDKAPPGMAAAGAAAGLFGLSDAVADGFRKGAEIVRDAGLDVRTPLAISCSDDPANLTPLWHVGGSKAKAFVDFQHDVTDRDVVLAAREGFVSVEHMKRYTTLGMATDQGKTSQVNGHAILAAATGKSIAETGTILSRPPYTPVAIGLLAGHHREAHFRPERRTPSHSWAIEQGATFVDAGQWKRAQWYARAGEGHWLDTVNREVLTTRTGVGICDVSTLGKIDILGPDAGTLLDRLYINNFSTLSVGRARYGVMLREDGFVFDDGTTTRFAEHAYFMTTTTANAARVMQHIDYARQVLWPELDVQATSATEQWATIAVAGPQSRALLQKILPETDLSNDAVPYMAAMELCWHGHRARLFRLSFSGELAYEFSVPAHKGEALVRTLVEEGRPWGAVPYGTEALGVMRIEKGHAAGNELNGQTTATDLGMARMMSTKKDYLGRAMALRPALTDPGRPRLVGLRPLDESAQIRAGAHLLPAGAALNLANDQGHVTSAAYSPTLGSWVALGLLRHGPERHGETVLVHDPVRGADVLAQVCEPIFYDPNGERVRG